MAIHPSRDPEPVLIELVPLDAAGEAGHHADRPPPAGAGTMPRVVDVVALVVDRALDTPDPPLVHPPASTPGWAGLRVHRLLRLPPGDAARALGAVLATCDGLVPASASGCTRAGWAARRTDRSRAHLEVLRPTTTADRQLVGALHVRRHGRATPVDIVLEPWSDLRTGLALQPRRRPGPTGLHLPRRYFDVAHRVMDVLWHEIEAAAAT